MVIKQFPPVESADEYGIIGVGGDLELESLELAYRSGIFPWPINNNYLTWFAPQQRAVLFLDNYHCPNSLKKIIKKSLFIIKVNQAFEDVIIKCQKAKRKKESSTWITDKMVDAYIELHKAGMAFSIEAYLKEQLVGGLYGVNIGMFCGGESMFHEIPNASKCCFNYLVEICRKNDCKWIDCQVINPFTESFGAIEIDRADYMSLLTVELNRADKIDFDV